MARGGIINMAASGLELPPDLIGGAARLTLLGREQVSIINHRGIVAYAPERILLQLSDGRLEINGSGLNLSELNEEQLTIGGLIASLVFREEADEE
ncbi:MAG: sporulation protein YqfC [Clostridia bacterium]|nr:sporulation protein YqfC [Clostridia bacterium]